MSFTAGVISRPVAVTMFTLGVLVFGYFSYERLAVNLMPDISYPSITVRTEYEGAAPEEVEDLVSIPIEEALAAVRGLNRISSVSRAGASDVILELAWESDLDQATIDIRQKLDLIEMPEDTTRPRILRYNPALEPIMKYGLYADGSTNLYALRRMAERDLKPQLERIPGVAAAKVQGGLEAEILIEVDESALVRFNVSMDLIKERLAQENVNLAGGLLSHGQAEYLLRTTNEFRDLPEMGQIILARRGNAEIRLKDVAAVRSVAKDRKVITRIDGLESVELAIYKEADANTVAISRQVQHVLGERTPESLAEAKKAEAAAGPKPEEDKKPGAMGPERPKTIADGLPQGVFLKLVADQAHFIRQAIDEVLSAALVGGLLSVLVLYFFLQELLPTLIIGLAIPISIVATFALMYFYGVSINIMSLGGLALGIGMLVDDAIVVLESIFRCREEGDPPVEAARRGTNEVFMAVVSTTLTTVAVFFPLSFVEGVAGQVFVDQALTVTFSLLTSMVVSFTVVPMLAGLQMPKLAAGGGGESGLWIGRLLGGGLRRGGARFQRLPRPLRAVLRALGYPYFVLVELLSHIGRATVAQLPVLGWPAQRYRLGRGQGEGRLSAAARLLYRAPGSALGHAGRWLVRRPAWASRGVGAGLGYWLLVFLPLLLLRLVVLLFLLVAGVLRTVLILAARLFEIAIVTGLVLAGGAVYLLLRLLQVVLYLPMKGFQAVYTGTSRVYPRVLGLALDHPGLVLTISAASMAASVLLWQRLGNELVPKMHQGEFSVTIKRPVGTDLMDTDRAVTAVEGVARSMPDLGSMYATVGLAHEGGMAEATERENEAMINFRLGTGQQAAESSLLDLIVPKAGENMVELEERAVEHLRPGLARLPGVATQLQFPSLFSFKTPVEVEIKGHDLLTLRRFSGELVARLRQLPGLHDVRSNVEEGYPEVQIRFDRDHMAARGLELQSVAQLVRDKIQGAVPTRYSELERKIDMRVRLAEQDRQSMSDLAGLIVNPGGTQPIPLSAVARLELGQGPSEIKRIDQVRVAVISANVTGVDLGRMAERIEEQVRGLPKPPGFSVSVRGQSTEMKAAFQSLMFALILAVFLVYLIMASQFESFLQPFIILFTIPMGGIGVLVVLYLLQIPLSIMVYMGIILLAGVVVDNAIILIDYVNLLRTRGLALREAILQGCSVRLRPILMSSATTVLGVLPMALGLGEGAEMRMPLAVTIISGLVSATVLTLIIIPTIYSLITRDEPAA